MVLVKVVICPVKAQSSVLGTTAQSLMTSLSFHPALPQVQLSAALEALASVSSCEEADQSPGPPPPPPPPQTAAVAAAAGLAAGKAHSLESAPEQPVQ